MSVTISGPVADNGYWCTICCLEIKAAALQANEAEIRRANEPGGPDAAMDITAFAASTPGKLNKAVALGFPADYGPPQLGGNGLIPGMVPVCWVHLMGVAVVNGVATANPMEVAAFGHGVPEIGRRR